MPKNSKRRTVDWAAHVALVALVSAIIPVAGALAGSDAAFYYLHGEAPVGTLDWPTGTLTFDSDPPTGTQARYAADVPVVGNGTAGGPYDPDWAGEITGMITSLTLDFWQKQIPGEATSSVRYRAHLWVGGTQILLPSFTTPVTPGPNPTRVVVTLTEMLKDGNPVPMAIEAGGAVLISIRQTGGTGAPADNPLNVGTVIVFDSRTYPSGFGINGATRPGEAPATGSPGATATPSPGATPPEPGQRHRRSISLTFRHRDDTLVAQGRLAVSDGYGQCTSRVPVRLQHRTGSEWAPVGAGRTNNRGRYRIATADDEGPYRAVAPRVVVEGETCLAASVKRRHVHE